MPIHRIDLPHTPTSNPSASPNDSFLTELTLDNSSNSSNNSANNSADNSADNNNNSNYAISPDASSPNTNQPHTPHQIITHPPKNIASVSLLRNKTKSSVQLSLKSATSLQSMLSNHSATTEYSPNLIDRECGDLLKIIDLDLNEESEQQSTNQKHQDCSKISSTAQFQLHSDTDTDLDHTEDENIADDTFMTDSENHPSLYKTTSSSDLDSDPRSQSCGCHHFEDFQTIDYSQTPIAKLREKWVFVLIGLPACGKSTMIKHFCNYVQTKTNNRLRVKSYNAGDIRRIYELQGHKKFNFNDVESSQKLRNFYAFEAMKNLTTDLQNDLCDIGILDATNTTCERRAAIINFVNDQNTKLKSNPKLFKLRTLILEIKCSNRALRRFNIDQKSKNKDYIHVDHDTAIKDFLERIDKYEKSYDKVTVQEIKNLNVKYFGIDNVGDSIYYDCGLHHHNNITHRHLTFKSPALNLLYQFLITYRTNYAYQYLTNVDTFYTEGHYVPIQTPFSKPVQLNEVPKVNTNTNYKLPKVLSQTRINK